MFRMLHSKRAGPIGRRSPGPRAVALLLGLWLTGPAHAATDGDATLLGALAAPGGSGGESLLAKAGSGGALSRSGCPRALEPSARLMDLVPDRPSAHRSLLDLTGPGAFPLAPDAPGKGARSEGAC